ncbi:FkbM family methyltransferase [Haloferax prahovense]|uniref:FkbM family methyltransferase n=1 Tax=Haloferax TaxID=2251 RepID=UPI000737C2CB|nr:MULTISPECIES: FkbM family methyltransferase [unclassified Haloferax]MCO8266124.1 FkbM family methyltransferase [Haloferax sp. AB510]
MHSVNYIYNNTIREALPRKVSEFSGVKVKKERLFDLRADRPNYKPRQVSALTERVGETDSVGIIGGGWGVSAVIAAEHGERVTVYEASDEQVEHVKTTLALNGADTNTDVVHGLVAEGRNVYGDSSAAVVSPGDLPAFDVLEMDCEGAEVPILRGLTCRPRVLIVETHPKFDAPDETVCELVESLGYDIASVRPKKEASEGSVVVAEHSRD